MNRKGIASKPRQEVPSSHFFDVADNMVDISVIIPVLDEKDNLKRLLPRLERVLDSVGLTYEVIFVDDGSQDGSTAVLRESAAEAPRIRLIEFVRNFGQTAALVAGFDHARGEIIIAMDADLQNDPADIPLLLDKLDEGYDVVSCWRRNRKDPWLRVILSSVANRLISWISGVHLHDYGCTLKAYRCHVVRHIRLYGEMHRFIPIYASWAGAKIAELEVSHHPRRNGQSKYGQLSRTMNHESQGKPIYITRDRKSGSKDLVHVNTSRPTGSSSTMYE
jgi:glycosyltransferase involved in cell wall biosynthesis